MSGSIEPVWKRWLDRFLMLNVLVVFIGAGFFGVAVVAQAQGRDQAMDLFQALWQPLFTPAISLLIMAAVLSGIFSWWQRRVMQPDRGSEN
jgi:Na+/phosphate symporter